MPALHLFNPQNDLALAAGTVAYTPPGPAAAFARAGAVLPAWWADEGDVVMAPSDDTEWLRRVHGISVEHRGARFCTEGKPWGWSANAARIMQRAGLPAGALPPHLGALRGLSHRRTAMALRRALGVDTGAEVATRQEAAAYLAGAGGRVFAKSPWSCSGRGVIPLGHMPAERALDAVEGIIRRQGSAMLEHDSGKGLDFAALFASRDGRVDFEGWSVFQSSDAGAYGGNVVAPQERLRNIIGRHTDISAVERAVSLLAEALTREVAPLYSGPIGIDMLAAADGHLNPCIEMNLRRTMGFVARDVAARLDIEGRLVMTAGPDDVLLCPPSSGFSIGIIPQAGV